MLAMSTAIGHFSLPASTGQTLSFESFRGKVPIAMVFLGDLSAEEERNLLTELDSHLKDFGSQRAQLLIVSRVTARVAREVSDEMGLAVPLLADASGALAREHGAEDETGRRIPVAILADKDGAIVRRFDPLPEDDPASAIEALLYSVRALGSTALSGPGG
jgi:peroxiredoxin